MCCSFFTRNPVFNLIKRIRVFRNWLTIIRIYQRKTDPNTTIITRNGLKITIRKIIDVAIIDEIFTWKIYDQYPFKLQHDGIVIDIGANIGIFSLYAASRRNQVYSYEPFKANYDLFCRNISQNKLGNNIHPEKKAISGKDSNRLLYIDRDNSGAHSFYGVGEGIPVKCINLKKIFEDNRIDICNFLKIDCEGAEYEIIENTEEDTLKKIQTIVMEYHDSINVKKIANKLKLNNFKIKIEKNPPILRAKKLIF